MFFSTYLPEHCKKIKQKLKSYSNSRKKGYYFNTEGKRTDINTLALAGRGDLTGDEEQECNHKIMRCFRYHSSKSKNNQPRLRWLYPSMREETHLAEQSPTFPRPGKCSEQALLSSHSACWLLHCFTPGPAHKRSAALSSKHLT